MLAAMPDRNSSLGLFEVVLRSVETHPATDVSETLKDHVVEVLRTALSVASNPSTIRSDTSSEAIELALLIRRDHDLQARLSSVADFDNIQRDLAKDLIRSIHSLAA